MKNPLVSIMIPNFNHSKFLDQSITSALEQTYRNIEVVILDNCSTDNSIEVASKYLTDKRVRLCQNQINMLNKSYNIMADSLINGKYMIMLCADDFIFPTFIEEAVDILEAYPNVAYVHGEKDFYTEDGTIQVYDPFYRCSFVAPGINAMPIYMLTTVAHPSQGVIRRSAFMEIGGYDKEIDHMNADKTLWFYLSEKYDAAYIREKRCGIRIGAQTETFVTQRNFQHPILCHLTIKDFVKYAKNKGITKVIEREEAALERLAQEFLGYAAGMLSVNDYRAARQYLTYSIVLSRKVQESELYEAIDEMINSRNLELEKLKGLLSKTGNKKRNYEPPEGYIELHLGINYGKGQNSDMHTNAE